MRDLTVRRVSSNYDVQRKRAMPETHGTNLRECITDVVGINADVAVHYQVKTPMVVRNATQESGRPWRSTVISIQGIGWVCIRKDWQLLVLHRCRSVFQCGWTCGIDTTDVALVLSSGGRGWLAHSDGADESADEAADYEGVDEQAWSVVRWFHLAVTLPPGE